jgi:hypothetical protein
LRSIFNHELTQYQRFLAEKAKLRERIMTSVSDSKQSQLPAEESIRQWLEHLAESTRPSDYQMREMIRAKHRAKMSIKHTEWPRGGPQKWITEWQKIMQECQKWCVSLHEQWISDFDLVWGEVHEVKFLCDQMRLDQKRGNSDQWTIYKASQDLLDAWKKRSIRNGMKPSG